MWTGISTVVRIGRDRLHHILQMVGKKYSEDELKALEKVFKNPRNRGRTMTAREFKKHQEKL